METNSTLEAAATIIRRALARSPLVPVGVLAIVAAVAVSIPWGVSAQVDSPSRTCGTHTLHGDYGLVGTGVRGLGPGVSETFATISMVTYDGQGGFTAVGV